MWRRWRPKWNEKVKEYITDTCLCLISETENQHLLTSSIFHHLDPSLRLGGTQFTLYIYACCKGSRLLKKPVHVYITDIVDSYPTPIQLSMAVWKWPNLSSMNYDLSVDLQTIWYLILIYECHFTVLLPVQRVWWYQCYSNQVVNLVNLGINWTINYTFYTSLMLVAIKPGDQVLYRRGFHDIQNGPIRNIYNSQFSYSNYKDERGRVYIWPHPLL